MANIIVVEDDPNFNRILSIYLSNHGHQVQSALSAQEAYDKMYNQLFDMILSDVMMPNIDGFEFTETVRKINPNIPILFVTAKDDIQSKQRGFHLVSMIIWLNQLICRNANEVTALLRRAHVANDRKLTIGNTVLDADSVSIMVDSQEISVTVREFNILFKLLSYPNKTFSRSQLLVSLGC